MAELLSVFGIGVVDFWQTAFGFALVRNSMQYVEQTPSQNSAILDPVCYLGCVLRGNATTFKVKI